MFRLYGDPISGNCLKAGLILHLTGRPFEFVTTSVVDGETRTETFKELNPDGRVPVLAFPDGRRMAESNAILCALARGTAYRPERVELEDRVFEWLFFEQYSHEPNIATLRFWRTYKGIPSGQEDVVASKEEAGRHTLSVLDRALESRAFLVGDVLTIADIALFAYTHVADEGGFDLNAYPNIPGWLGRVKDETGTDGLPHFFKTAPSVARAFAAA